MGNKSEAELALQRKYELLRQKKLKEQQQTKNAAAQGSKPQPSSSSDKPKVDPVRQAAIEALKKKRAAEAAGGAASPPSNAAKASSQAAGTGDAKPGSTSKTGTSIKLKFVIPKREGSKPPEPSQGDGAAAAAAGESEKSKPAGSGQKRPVRRAPRPPAVKSEDQSQEPPAKRPAIDSQQPEQQPLTRSPTPSGYDALLAPQIPSIPRLFIGDLPDNFTSDQLYDFISQFRPVHEAHVVSQCCFGFATLTSFEDAEALLNIHSHQPVQLGGRELRLAWAREGTGPTVQVNSQNRGMGGIDSQPVHPRMQEARAAAAQVAEQIDQDALAAVNLHGPPPMRHLVCYDDL